MFAGKYGVLGGTAHHLGLLNRKRVARPSAQNRPVI